MTYLLTFLEGILSFLSPCILPMLPIYLSYFSGSSTLEERSVKRTLKNVTAFILGFTVILIAIGAISGVIGQVLLHQVRSSTALNVITGSIVILFGLSYLGLFKLPFFSRLTGPQLSSAKLQNLTIFSSFVFGLVFAIAWSPCFSTFLGAAMTQAAISATAFKGSLTLFAFAMGLGIPFFLATLLMEQLAFMFDFIKKHFGIINKISGFFLILVGITMITGHFGGLLLLFT